jgi:hypothetical protein
LAISPSNEERQPHSGEDQYRNQFSIVIGLFPWVAQYFVFPNLFFLRLGTCLVLHSTKQAVLTGKYNLLMFS